MPENKYLKFYKYLPKKYRFAIIYTIVLYFFSSLFEVLTIASLNPLANLLLKLSKDQYVDYINLKLLNYDIQIGLNNLLFISILFSTCAIFLRFFSLRNTSKYSQIIGSFLANRVLTSILINSENESNLEYQGSDSIAALTSVQIDYAITSINAQMQLINVLFTSFILGVGIIFIQPLIASGVLLMLSLFFILSALLTKPIIKKNAIIISKNALNSIKESINLYQIRDQLRINKNFSFDTLLFNNSHYKQKLSVHLNNFLSTMPRVLLDYFIFLAIPFLILSSIIFNNGNFNFSTFLPSLVTLGVSLQRILPSINQIFRQWSRVKGFSPSLFKILEILYQCREISHYEYKLRGSSTNFRKKTIDNIIINNMSYITSDKKYILKNCNLEICKGESLCIFGESGSGKTTFVKLVCGLLKPSCGKILIDGKNIQNFASHNHKNKFRLDIAYIPQSGSIISGSIIENIVLFSTKKINQSKINKILEITLCNEFIEKLPYGLSQIVGDKSDYKLSGGQIQRLAIARALYNNPSMIVMDESTNALDKKKEELLIQNLIKYYKGILVQISHRNNYAKFFKHNILVKNKSLYRIN